LRAQGGVLHARGSDPRAACASPQHTYLTAQWIWPDDVEAVVQFGHRLKAGAALFLEWLSVHQSRR
jgi:hypothetical protein